MKLIVNPHKIEIEKTPVNEREINISKCEFVFADEITNDYVKEAYFTFKGITYKQIIVNNECAFPSEVLVEKGDVEIGVVAYLVENGDEIKRYNPSPAYFNTWLGSLKDNAENSEPITPSEMEQYEQALQDGLNDIADAIENAERLDIDVNKDGNKATVEITKQNGTTKSVDIYDGPDGKDAKINGVNTLNIVAGDNITLEQEDNTLKINATGGGSGTSNYNNLQNKPQINNVTLSGNKSLSDLGIQPAGNYLTEETDPVFSASAASEITNSDIDNWNSKGTYSKPTGGIPKSDLASGVQSSLNKADTALQPQDISGKLDVSKVKNETSTTAGDVYDVRYINSMIGDIESLLSEV